MFLIFPSICSITRLPGELTHEQATYNGRNSHSLNPLLPHLKTALRFVNCRGKTDLDGKL